MKKRIILGQLVISIYLVICSHGPRPKPPWEKENVSFPMMNQEIRHSMQENERQVDMKNKQVSNTALENTNKTQWEKLEKKVKKIQNRLRFVDFAMQGTPTGVKIYRKGLKIKEIQEAIIREVKSAPYTIAWAGEKELHFIDDFQMTLRLLVGIVASYGAINQMEKADRKILLDYALSEVERIERESEMTLFMVREVKRRMEFSLFKIKFWKNQDKEIVKEILSNI
ncbi:hypothetical protein [Riemerella columbipharyngis]|uniref:Uncharacterized protein n=1 Tax=Riemerella columbipharyngis TaxID=1071918 RepID=A0A1G6ZCK8_9FLAO|nr:hypothetical protein [Riemerella columbipharyngis]SDD99827.1 hypothetical protein SAMN05421544_10226 [Riemerella columbipharyngis]